MSYTDNAGAEGGMAWRVEGEKQDRGDNRHMGEGSMGDGKERGKKRAGKREKEREEERKREKKRGKKRGEKREREG